MPLKHHPHKTNNENTFFNKLVYLIGILGPILTIPQIIKIYSTQDASGISLLSWSFYLFGSIVFLIYAFKKKLKPLILMYFGWIIVHSIMIAGILIY